MCIRDRGKAKAAMSTMNISKSWIGAILITRLLMTLDDDNDPTKMNIPESVRTSASNLAITDVQALNDSGLHTLVTDLGQDPNTIVSQAAAESQLAGTIFSENDATASSITGGWISSDVVPVIIAFLDSTHYVSIQDLPAIGGGTPGMEMGTFTWNLTNGRFVAAPTVDTDGEYSFSDLTGDMTFSVKDSTATFLIGGADGLHTATRIAPDASNPLVGTWYISDWYGSDILMVFLANGEYYGTLNNIDSYFGHDGMEHGKYTYNSTTKQFMKTQIITDTDGSPSFAGEPEPDVAVTATVSGQNLTFGYQEGDQMVLQRVGQ